MSDTTPPHRVRALDDLIEPDEFTRREVAAILENHYGSHSNAAEAG